MSRPTRSRQVLGIGLVVVLTVAYHMTQSRLFAFTFTLWDVDASNNSTFLFYIGYYTERILRDTMPFLPGLLAATIMQSRTPWVGALVGVLVAALSTLLAYLEWGRGVFYVAFAFDTANMVLAIFTNFCGAAAAVWWFNHRMPSNQPLHPDAPTRFA